MPADRRPTSAGRAHKEARLPQKTRAALLRSLSKHQYRAEINQNLQESVLSPAVSADESHNITISADDHEDIRRNEGAVQTTWIYTTVNTDMNTPRTAFTPQVGPSAPISTHVTSGLPVLENCEEDRPAPDTAGIVTPCFPDGDLEIPLFDTPRISRQVFRSNLPLPIPSTPINVYEIITAGIEDTEIEASAQRAATLNSPLPSALRPGMIRSVFEHNSVPIPDTWSHVEQRSHSNSPPILPPLSPSPCFDPYAPTQDEDPDYTVTPNLPLGSIDVPRHAPDTPPSPETMNYELSMETNLDSEGCRSQGTHSWSRRSAHDDVSDDDRWDSGIDAPAEDQGDLLAVSKIGRVKPYGFLGKHHIGLLPTASKSRSRNQDKGETGTRVDGESNARCDNSTDVQRGNQHRTQQTNPVLSDTLSDPLFHEGRAKGKEPARVFPIIQSSNNSGLQTQSDDCNSNPLGLHSGPARGQQYVAHDGSIRPYDSSARDASSRSESLRLPILRLRPKGPRNQPEPRPRPTTRYETYAHPTIEVAPPPANLNHDYIEMVRSSESLGIQPDATHDDMLHVARYPPSPDRNDADYFLDHHIHPTASNEPHVTSPSPEPQQEYHSIQDTTDGNHRPSFWQIMFTSSSTDWPGPAGRIARGGYEAGLALEVGMKKFGKSFYDEMMK